jgi:hypothetical protein
MFGIKILTTAIFNGSHFCRAILGAEKWWSDIAIGDKVDLDIFSFPVSQAHR